MKPAVLGIAAALVLAASAAVASAQPALTPPQVPAQETQLVAQPLESKDPGTATLLSIGGTVAPLALLYAASQIDSGQQAGTLISVGVAGLLLGPSLGHWYAHDYLTGGLAMRVTGSALMLLGVGEALGCLGEYSGCNDHGDSGAAPLIVGAGVFAAGAIVDIATAGRSANHWNTAHVQLVPAVIGSAGRQTMGVGLGGSF